MPPPEAGAGSREPLARLLREARSGLDLPPPARVRVLGELAGDAEALYRELRERGWSEEAAARRVRELLLPTGPARDALQHLHAPLYRRIERRFSPALMRRWERLALALLAATAVAGGAGALATVPFLEARSPFLVPVMALGGAGLLLALVRGFQLLVRGVDAEGPPGWGLAPLLILSGLTAGLTVAGFSGDLYRFAARMERAWDPSGQVALAFLRAEATLVVVGFTLALALGLAWFLLLQRRSALEAAEDFLMEG